MNKTFKYIKAFAIILLLVGLILYVIFAMFTMTGPDEEEICENVELVVDQDSRVQFVNVSHIEDLLRRHHLYPKGRLMKDVNTRAIELLIRQNEFVEDVECYKTTSGKLRINVKQRNPVIYVIPDGKDGYYVDSVGRMIPDDIYTSNIIVATGDISREYASKVLSGFGNYLCTDEFWNSQIEQVYVFKDREKKPVVELVPRVGEHVVYLGSMDDYQKKLRRLRTFYEKAMGTVGWNKYSRINLEFKNQIVCTKRKIK